MQPPRTYYAKHISASSLATIASALAGIWLARFLAHELGLAGYAVVAMAGAFTMALTVFTSSANSAVGRFLTEALARSDGAAASRVFSSALFGMIAVALSLIPAIWIAAACSPTILDAGTDPELVRAYILLILLATLVLAVTTVFASSAFAASRFDLLSGLQTFQVLLRAAFVALLVLLWEPTVRSVGTGALVSALAALAVAIVIWRRVTPDLAVRLGAVSAAALGAMLAMSLWVGVDTVGMLMVSGLSTVLLGKLDGVGAAAYYGLYLSVVACVVQLGGALGGPVQPSIYAAFARGDRGEATRLLTSSARTSLAVLALLAGGVVGLRRELVGLWLGDGYGGIADPIAVGVPLSALAIAATCPCLAVLNARERTWWIAASTVAAGVGHLGTCLTLYALGRLEVVSVALSAGAWLVAKTLALLWLSFDDACYAVKAFLRLAGHFAVLFLPPLVAATVGGAIFDLPALGKTLVVGLAAATAWAVSALWAVSPGDVDYLLGRAWRDTTLGTTFLRIQARKASTSPRRQRHYTRFRRLPRQLDAVCGPGLDAVLAYGHDGGPRGPLRVLVLGCANGAEPYSLVSEIRRRRPGLAVEALGVDVDPAQIARAREGLYTLEEVGAGSPVDDDFVSRAFEVTSDGRLRVRDELRQAVAFEVGDVLSASFLRDVAMRRGPWDVVAAQNFLIHMSGDTACQALKNVFGAMAPACLLLLDGVDLDLKTRLTREAGLEPLSYLVREIHEQNERRASWGDLYVGLEPFDERKPDHLRRYATVYVRRAPCCGIAADEVGRALSPAEARA